MEEGIIIWSYYGSKSKIIDLYPAPKYGKIIEPFAGSARYALKYWERDVLLVDCRQVIIKIWHYLQQASEKDIINLPRPSYKQSLTDYSLSEGERLFMGFMIGRGASHPRKCVQKFSYLDRDLIQVANQLYKIRHWVIRQDDYRSIDNTEATYFIDPPYLHGGKNYRTPAIDYNSLAHWSQSRLGQVIVCENTKADWLPFWAIKNQPGAQHTNTTEAMWCNDLSQPRLF